jgi:TldD protein
VEEGFQIQDGKKKMVRGATLLGNGPETLLLIDKVGSDHGWAIGTCGKEGQGVPVSDALPTVHIKKLVVGGQ